MAFDPNLDKQLFAEAKEFETTRITVSVQQYNEGEKKLQIARENKSAEGEYRFAKLGRMVKGEAEAILPLIKKALEFM